MFKHIQTIRRQIADELFGFVWLFCGIGAERVKTHSITKSIELFYSGVVVVVTNIWQ